MKKLTAKEIAALFKEWREDYAAAKLRDMYGKQHEEALKKILDGGTEADGKSVEAPAAEKGKDKGIER